MRRRTAAVENENSMDMTKPRMVHSGPSTVIWRPTDNESPLTSSMPCHQRRSDWICCLLRNMRRARLSAVWGPGWHVSAIISWHSRS